MRGYNQYCPIARAAEVFAERWTPLIVRNMFVGCETYTEILSGAPGLPRSVLSQRLRHLARLGLVERKEGDGRTARYLLTDSGRDLWDTCMALGTWGAKWLEVTPHHLDPYMVLWSIGKLLDEELLPDRRVVIRFEFTGYTAKRLPAWLIIERPEGEVCLKHPGFEENLFIQADAKAFMDWYMGETTWANAIRTGSINVQGTRTLTRAFPTWIRLSPFARVKASG